MAEEQLQKRISILMNEYDMSTRPKIGEDGNKSVFCLGKVHIFNNQIFDEFLGLKPRTGSDKDVEALTKTFQNLNFPEPKIHRDLKRIPFEQEIEKIANDENNELKQCGSLVCVFLSHGVDGHIYMRNGKVEVDYIYETLCGVHNENLRDKPKIFIFQACRGSQGNDTGNCDAEGFTAEVNAHASSDVGTSDETDANEESFFESDGVSGGSPRGADCLTAYSTTKGYVSFRNVLGGSWFIQKLCEVFNDYAAGMYDKYHPDIIQLLTLVSAEVSEKSINHQGRSLKQMPSFVSTLRRRWFLRNHAHVPVQEC